MPTSQLFKLKNIQESLHKFLFDNIFTDQNIDITSDESVEFHPRTDKKWINIKLLDNDLNTMQHQDVQFILGTRDDGDGDELLDLRDILLGCLTNPDATDGFRRRFITLYNTDDPSNLVEIGKMEFLNLRQSPVEIAPDQTKYMIVDGMLYSETR